MGVVKEKIKLVCQHCGKEFLVTEWYRNKKFCSKDCLSRSREKIVLICKQCGKEFLVTACDSDRKFCCFKCLSLSRERIKLKCQSCKEEFFVSPSEVHRKFCCKNCQYLESHKLVICDTCGKEFRKTKSQYSIKNYCTAGCYRGAKSVDLVCDNCGKAFKKTISQLTTRNYCSTECMGAGQSKYRRGENSANWKGGITTEHDKKRKIAGLKEWRISVYARDDYTCQHCGVRGGTLNAHHIKRFRDYPELRTELSNGITLCVECHKIETRKEMLADKDLRSRRAEAKELKKAAEEYTDEGRN